MGYCTHVGLMVPLTWCRQHGVDRLVPLNSRVVLKPAGPFLRTKVNVFFQGWDASPGARGFPPAFGAVPRRSGPKQAQNPPARHVPRRARVKRRTRACNPP